MPGTRIPRTGLGAWLQRGLQRPPPPHRLPAQTHSLEDSTLPVKRGRGFQWAEVTSDSTFSRRHFVNTGEEAKQARCEQDTEGKAVPGPLPKSWLPAHVWFSLGVRPAPHTRVILSGCSGSLHS